MVPGPEEEIFREPGVGPPRRDSTKGLQIAFP